MASLRSYPKVHNLGHAAVREIFADPVEISRLLGKGTDNANN